MVKVMPPLLHILMGPWKHTHTLSLTSGGELFGVDDFGGVLLARAELDTAAHH